MAKAKRILHVFNLARDKVPGEYDYKICPGELYRLSRDVDSWTDWRAMPMATGDEMAVFLCAKYLHAIAETAEGKPYRLRPGAKPRRVRLKLIVEEIGDRNDPR